MKTVNNQPQEWKLVSLRECPTPEEMQICDGPKQAAKNWDAHVTSHPHFNPDCECLVVLLLNTRRKIKGHHLVSIGLLDQILVHPREVFRLAIVAAASAIVVMPSQLGSHALGSRHPGNARPHPCRATAQDRGVRSRDHGASGEAHFVENAGLLLPVNHGPSPANRWLISARRLSALLGASLFGIYSCFRLCRMLCRMSAFCVTMLK